MRHTHRHRQAFTLIELLAVMSVMVILLTIAVGASMHWGRGTAMRTSVQNVKTSLGKARQWAVTHGERTSFAYSNNNDAGALRGEYWVASDAHPRIGKTEFLARGVVFTNVAAGWITFKSDGTCVVSTTNFCIEVCLVERDRGTNALAAVIQVHGLSGYANEIER